MVRKSNKQKAILVEAVFNRYEGDHLAELSELAYVAGYDVVGRVTQNLPAPKEDYCFGKGKAKMIKGRIKELDANIVIVENRLTQLQQSNLQKMWHVEIIDRFELILEIFTNEAGTQEALTQIKLAALKKTGSRFSRFHSKISRDKLIKKLERKLELIKKAKDLRRKRRIESGFDLVAIAGYTNAGKSTLMNALTDADVEVSGRMFTTLDTTTRSLDSLGRKILITDTVGFISRLPHELMDAFYATLKEIKEADLIILLIDGVSSKENIKRKVLTSMNTFIAIGAEGIPMIPVINKIDVAVNIDEKKEIVEAAVNKEALLISAFTGEGLKDLQEKIMDILTSIIFHVRVPMNDNGFSFVSEIHDKTRVLSKEYKSDIINLRFETNERLGNYYYGLLQKEENATIHLVNEEEVARKLGIKKPETDDITIIETADNDEIIVLDLIEEENGTDESIKTVHSKTKSEKNKEFTDSHTEAQYFSSLADIKKT
jgi:GTP-binding protein HflX